MESHAIHSDQRNGNLHIKLHGRFTSETAVQLSCAIASTYTGKGNIFIHTAQVTAIAPESRHTFTNLINVLGLPREKMYLTGVQGLDISPDKARVIVYEKKEKGCCGKCRNCGCHGQHGHASHDGEQQQEKENTPWQRH